MTAILDSIYARMYRTFDQFDWCTVAAELRQAARIAGAQCGPLDTSTEE